MELYIHFGIYKAGSSYIQYSCAVNRSYLEKRGFYFARSPYDMPMQQGIISPGNASHLANYLKERDEERTTSLVNRWITEAKEVGCSHILVSAEALIHVFATKEGLQTLEKAASKAGISKIHALGYFRDLIDHAISTYKHRAKTGRLPDFESWLKVGYETPHVLRSFFDIHKDTGIHWSLRRFQKNTDFMLTSFYTDWLKIEAPPLGSKPKVNESVTLSEVMLMNHIAKIYPGRTDYFVDAFKSLDRSEKGNDDDLENAFYSKAFQVLQHHSDLIQRINKFFAPDEGMRIGEAPSGTGKAEIVLSEQQVEALMKTIDFFKGAKGKVVSVRRFLVNLLPKSAIRSIGNFGDQKIFSSTFLTKKYR